MDEDKVPRSWWFVGAFVVLAVTAAKYYLAVKASRNSKKNVKSVVNKPNHVPADMYKQFFIKLGETASIESEGLKIKFAKVSEDSRIFRSNGKVNGGFATIKLEVDQTVGSLEQGASYELSDSRGEGRVNPVLTADDLTCKYQIRLLGLTSKDSGDYVANLVVIKDG